MSYIHTVVVEIYVPYRSSGGVDAPQKHEFIRVSMEWVHYDLVSNSCTTDPVDVVPCENSHSSFTASSSVDRDR